jgi:hypothetical protein
VGIAEQARGTFQVKRVAVPAAFEAAAIGRHSLDKIQHFALMNRGTPTLTLTVVPDTGTDALTGLAGSMKIIIEKGQHSYEFDYTLEA